MRIGLDARNVVNKGSGLVNYVLNLALEVGSKEKNELYLFCQKKYQEAFSDLASKKNVHLIYCYFNNSFLHYSNFLYEQTLLFKKINDLNLDIFHNPFGFGIPGLIHPSPILTVHDLIPLFSDDGLSASQNFIYKKSLDISLNKAHHVVAISEFTKDELIRYKPELQNKISVIHNGFDNMASYTNSEDVFKTLQKKYDLQTPYILYVGSGTKRKNLESLVAGYIEAKKRYAIPHTLVLVSKFNRKETLKTLSNVKKLLNEAHMENNLILLGYLTNEEKAVIMDYADFFVYPSTYEGFGLPVLEAMSVSTPVICSNIAPFKEIAGEAALYFDPLDKASIASAINTVHSSPALKNKLSNLGKKQSLLYSWNKMVHEYESLYSDLFLKQSS